MNELPSVKDEYLTSIEELQRRCLPATFYLREDVVQVAKDLLGKWLVTSFDGQLCAGRIVETEAYKAPEDRASHAWNNRRTPRTETMFQKGGVAYVYLCYGMHHLFNVVTGPADVAHAVLIRAVEPMLGVQTMMRRRRLHRIDKRLCAGPAMLTQALGITTQHDGTCLYEADSPILLVDAGDRIDESLIEASPRIGVDYAGECATWEWRFTLKGSSWLSR